MFGPTVVQHPITCPNAMITSGPLESFFKLPQHPPSPDGDCVLYHLRIGLEKLYGTEDRRGSIDPNHVLLATIGILAGLDLLAQAYSGRPASGDKFVKLLNDLRSLDSDCAEAVYQLRCGLIHSLSLSAKSKRARPGVIYSFTVTRKLNSAFVQKKRDTGKEVQYEVNLWRLKECFTAVIKKLKSICESGGNSVVLNNVCQISQEKISASN